MKYEDLIKIGLDAVQKNNIKYYDFDGDGILFINMDIKYPYEIILSYCAIDKLYYVERKKWRNDIIVSSKDLLATNSYKRAVNRYIKELLKYKA